MDAVKTLTHYLKGSVEELKKVSWPTREETIRYSWIVIGLSLATALFFGVFDYILNYGFEFLVGIR